MFFIIIHIFIYTYNMIDNMIDVIYLLHSYIDHNVEQTSSIFYHIYILLIFMYYLKIDVNDNQLWNISNVYYVHSRFLLHTMHM